MPISLVVLPGTPSSIAVNVYGRQHGGRGVFILDDGLPRANFIQPPEVGASFLTNGPPGYLFGVGDLDNLVVFRLGAAGATYESYGGLVTTYNQINFVRQRGQRVCEHGRGHRLQQSGEPAAGRPVRVRRLRAGGSQRATAS